MEDTTYDEHVQFYLDFVDKGLAQEPSMFRTLVATLEELLGDRLHGARVCDVACGEGHLARSLAVHGAAEVVGVDLSSALISEAERRTNAPSISYHVDDAHHLSTLHDGSFDVCVSQMALMDIPDHRAAFRSIARILKSGGSFAFSFLHPCFETPYRLPDEPPWLGELTAPTAVVVRRYATEGFWKSGGEGVRGRMGSHHRMLSTYLNDLIECGFRIERLVEPLFPGSGLFAQVPRFLVVSSVLDAAS